MLNNDPLALTAYSEFIRTFQVPLTFVGSYPLGWVSRLHNDLYIQYARTPRAPAFERVLNQWCSKFGPADFEQYLDGIKFVGFLKIRPTIHSLTSEGAILSERTPLYESVFKFKDLLQYLKDKSFSDEVSITLRLKSPEDVSRICMDIELPNTTPDFVHDVVSPWIYNWLRRCGVHYTIPQDVQWVKDNTALLTYEIPLITDALRDVSPF